MKKRILIITNADDLHADIVECKLQARGASSFRINLDEFPRDYSIEICQSSAGLSGAVHHIHSDDRLSIDDVGAIWARKPAKFSFLSSDLTAQEKAFAQAETEHIFFSLLYSLECFWMSHPLAVRGALWKGEQLKRAALMGFRVPRSIISNCPDAVRRFKGESKQDIIIKAMSSSSLCAEDVAPDERRFEGMPTTRLSDEQFAEIDAILELPCLFQEYVPKQYELRITVIGDDVFAAKIDSQRDQRTEIDYRDFSVEIPYEQVTLPAEIAARCLQYVHSYGLEFGALDLIVTPCGEYVFLENNPGGQFLFVEQLVPQLRMTDAVAELLHRKALVQE